MILSQSYTYRLKRKETQTLQFTTFTTTLIFYCFYKLVMLIQKNKRESFFINLANIMWILFETLLSSF